MANPNRVSKEEVMSNAVLVTEVHPRSHAHGARPKSFRAPDRLSVDSLGGYLRSIGRYEILTAEEEGALATRIEVGLLARERLENAQSVDVERLDEQALRDLRELVADGEAAHRDFFLANLKLVVSIAKQYARQGAPMLDLIQDGNIGLDRAIKKFDHALGFKFSTYAVWWIRQAITRGLAETGHLIRVPVHTAEKIQKLRRIGADLDSALGRRAAPEELARESQLSLEEVRQLPLNTDDSEGELGDLIEDDDAPTIIELVTMTLRAERLRAEVARLPRRQARLLSMRYGLGGESPMSFEQVGTRMGISRERARQLEARALAALRCSDLE
jgi:RNA polymerase primary sigma factor